MQIITAVLVILVVLVLVTLAIAIAGYHFGWRWTGVVEDENFPYKTFWDWLSILIVPVLLTLGGILFTAYQGIRQQANENQRTETQQMIEDQRAQDAALQAYLDQMSQLMLAHDRHDAADGGVRTLAGAQTLTVLQSLDDQQHKKSVLRFLYEADLIDTPHPTVVLEGASLQSIDLKYSNLSGGPFSTTPYLRRCKPLELGGPGSSFGGDHADLSGANLEGANLRHAFLAGVDLKGVNLTGADLYGVSMPPDFSNAEQSGWRAIAQRGCDVADVPVFRGDNDFPFLPEDAVATDLAGASLAHTNMQEADVSGADLRGSDLEGANLSRANLKAANLEGADLKDANLEGANLAKARITDEQLKAASSLQGAILRDGTIKAMTLQGAAGPGGEITHGLYVTKKFKPALSFTLSEGSWRLSYPDTTDALSLQDAKGGELTFTSPFSVYDPTNPNELQEAPENAKGWISWFETHPNLDTSTPSPTTVGGASGMRIDVSATRGAPYNFPGDLCKKESCVPLFPIANGKVAFTLDTKDRFVIVDAGEKTVVFRMDTSPEDGFDELLPKAQKVLDSVEWKGM